jgi:drug/metabolite transporter (DMT)-like permease
MGYLIICSFVWAFSYGLIKENLTGLNPDFVAWTRMCIPLLLFLPFLKIQSLSKKAILIFTLIGALQYGIMYMLVIRSYKYLFSYQVVLFTACVPIYVSIIHDLLSRSFRFFPLVITFIAFSSIFVLYHHNLGGGFSLKGFFLVQLSDLCFAFGQVAYKHYKQKYLAVQDKNLYALLFLGGFIVTTVSGAVSQGWQSISMLSLSQTLLLFYLGAIASGLCFFWWNKAAVTVPISLLAVFNNMKIPLGVLVSLLFFHEKANLFALTFSSLLMALALFLSYCKEKSSIAA